MIKFPYQSSMRNQDGTIFPIQWLIANADAKSLPYETCFGSSRWNVEPTDDGGIGEIPERFPPKSIGFIQPWLKGDHVCGSADQWLSGWQPGTHIPPVDGDGVPLCCRNPGEAAFTVGFDLGFDS